MSDIIVRSTARARVERHQFAAGLAEFGRRTVQRAVDRFQREQTGQDMVEYAGVVLIVALIIGAVFASGIGNTISSGLSSLVNDVLSGKGAGGGGH
jgi:Flp pilus assembly pilin Flp